MKVNVVASWLVLVAAMSVSLSACSEPAQRSDSSGTSVLVSADEVDVSRLNAIGLKVQSVQQSPVAGVYEVITDQGLFYVANNGSLLISGRMYDINGAEPVNLSDLSLNTMRQQELHNYADSMLVFAATKGKIRDYGIYRSNLRLLQASCYNKYGAIS